MAKSSIKRKTCHTGDFGQVWPEHDTHDWPLDKVVTQQTMAKYGKNNDAPHWRTLSHCRHQPNVAWNVPLIGRLCHAADFDQMWPKMCPLSEDFVMQRTLTKCGPKCAPHWRTLSSSRLWPMWPKMCPSLEDFVTQRTSTKGGPKCAPHQRTLSHSGLWPNVAQMCPLLEDFVTQRTSTKCSPKCAPCWRTLSRSELWPNVAQNVPLVWGLCRAADFNQMLPKMCPLSEDFVTQ